MNAQAVVDKLLTQIAQLSLALATTQVELDEARAALEAVPETPTGDETPTVHDKEATT